MWLLASSTSPQLLSLADTLYSITRQKLDASSIDDLAWEVGSVEYTQAQVLLLLYEVTHVDHRCAYMTAGRCFRLLQLLRWYEIDRPDNAAERLVSTDSENAIMVEEKRRTFWMAYSLDRFMSIQREWPLTLNEQVVSHFFHRQFSPTDDEY